MGAFKFVVVMFSILAAITSGAMGQSCDDVDLSAVLSPNANDSPFEVRRHVQELEQPPAQVIVLGDSLVRRWPAELLGMAFLNKSIANFGVDGDRIQSLLWRLDAIAAKQLDPETVVLWIGTNNFRFADKACAIERGFLHITLLVRSIWPSARLVVVGLLPTGKDLNFRESERLAINQALRENQMATGYRLVDFGDSLRCASAPSAIRLQVVTGEVAECTNFTDNVHLSLAGYAIATKEISNALGGKIPGPPAS